MKGMKSCPKCKGGECKGGKNCMHEEKEEKNGKNGKNGKIEIEISLPMRGSRTAKSKAKKKK
jgi:hypothetical protein